MNIMMILCICVIVLMAVDKYYRYRKLSKLKVQHKKEIKEQREDAIKSSRAVIEGQVFEELCPYLPGWKHIPSDCRFLGSPIDYICFDGIHLNKCDEVVFVEVKTGKSRLNKRQQAIKKAIIDKRVKWETYKNTEREDDGSNLQ